MINYRVTNLDAMVKQLRDAGLDVDVKSEDLEYGRLLGRPILRVTDLNFGSRPTTRPSGKLVVGSPATHSSQ